MKRTFRTLLVGLIVVLLGLSACSAPASIEAKYRDWTGETIETVANSEDFVYTDISGGEITDDHLNFTTGRTYVADMPGGFLERSRMKVLMEFISVPACSLTDIPTEWHGEDANKDDIHPIVCLGAQLENSSSPSADISGLDIIGYTPDLNVWTTCPESEWSTWEQPKDADPMPSPPRLPGEGMPWCD